MVNAQEWLDIEYPKEEREEIVELNLSEEELEGSLNLKDFVNLKELDCSHNRLVNLDLVGLTELISLNCSFNQLTNLNLTGLIKLKELSCNDNILTSLDYSNLNADELVKLNVSDNNLSKQDLTKFNQLVGLKLLWVGGTDEEKIKQNIYNQIVGSLKPLSSMTNLEKLDISNTDIDSGWEYLPSSLKEINCSSENRPESKVKVIAEALDYKGDGKEVNMEKFWSIHGQREIQAKEEEIIRLKGIVKDLEEQNKRSFDEQDNLDKEINNLEEEKKNLQQQINRLNQELEQTKKQLTEKEEKLKSLTTEQSVILQKEVDLLKSRLDSEEKVKREEITSLQNQLIQVDLSIAKLGTERDKLVLKKEEKKRLLKKVFSKKQTSELEKEISSINEEIVKKLAESEQVQRSLGKIEDETKVIQQERSREERLLSLQNDIIHKEKLISELESESQQKTVELEKISADLKKISFELEATKINFEKLVEEQKAEISKLQVRNKDSWDRANAFAERIDELEQQVKKLQNELETAKIQVSQLKQQLEKMGELLPQIQSKDSELKELIETAKGELSKKRNLLLEELLQEQKEIIYAGNLFSEKLEKIKKTLIDSGELAEEKFQEL